ncbi:hypothetical protein SRHO_G00063060 [Serrasalmus rhombeus]
MRWRVETGRPLLLLGTRLRVKLEENRAQVEQEIRTRSQRQPRGAGDDDDDEDGVQLMADWLSAAERSSLLKAAHLQQDDDGAPALHQPYRNPLMVHQPESEHLPTDPSARAASVHPRAARSQTAAPPCRHELSS